MCWKLHVSKWRSESVYRAHSWHLVEYAWYSSVWLYHHQCENLLNAQHWLIIIASSKIQYHAKYFINPYTITLIMWQLWEKNPQEQKILIWLVSLSYTITPSYRHTLTDTHHTHMHTRTQSHIHTQACMPSQTHVHTHTHITHKTCTYNSITHTKSPRISTLHHDCVRKLPDYSRLWCVHVTLQCWLAEYIQMADKWLDKVLPIVAPYLYINGGPIITVQVGFLLHCPW